MAGLLAVVVLVGGLHGIVMRGPTMPVCKAGTPCSEPAVGVLLIFSRGDRAVARVRSGAGGRYSVRLAAGRYTVRLDPTARIGFGLRPAAVRVTRGVDRRLDFAIDTGIRQAVADLRLSCARVVAAASAHSSNRAGPAPTGA